MIYLINGVTLLCVALFFYSCMPQRTNANNGRVLVKTRYFDTTTKHFVRAGHDRDYLMWFRDSFVIQEVNHIYKSTDINNAITWNVIVERYKFIDCSENASSSYAL
jgi:hypothetical protein